jgi:2-C-methyl-D-erythritol 4-phosphate cytidylyltransferase
VAVALIVAAGSGVRLGAGRPKAFIEVAGRPLLHWSVSVLREVPAIERIVVALPPGYAAPAGTIGVEGGQVRSESVRRALAAAGPTDIVLVHDAARPLVTRELVNAVLGALVGVDAAIAAAPVSDTVKRADREGLVSETLPRSSLWSIQTPQAFRREALERALDVPAEVLAQATDDAWLIERAGGSVRIVAATAENLKVTTLLDLRIAELLLGERRGSCAPAAPAPRA